MVVSAGYFLDFVLGHRTVEMELSEIVDLSRDAYFAKKERTRHEDMSFTVDDGSMGACRRDFLDGALEAADG